MEVGMVLHAVRHRWVMIALIAAAMTAMGAIFAFAHPADVYGNGRRSAVDHVAREQAAVCIGQWFAIHPGQDDGLRAAR